VSDEAIDLDLGDVLATGDDDVLGAILPAAIGIASLRS